MHGRAVAPQSEQPLWEGRARSVQATVFTESQNNWGFYPWPTMDSSNKAAPNINTLSFPKCIWAYLTYFIFRAALSCCALQCRGGSAAAPPSLLGLLCLPDKLRINSPFDFSPEKSRLLRGKAGLEGGRASPECCEGAQGIPAAPVFTGNAGERREHSREGEEQSPWSLLSAQLVPFTVLG